MELLLLYLTSLFTMINPIGAIPLYSNLTSGMPTQQARKVAFQAGLTAFIALIFFAFSGQMIFNFFGISVNGLRIVGGVLFFVMGYEMLRGSALPMRNKEQDEEFDSEVAITPLGIPVIAGPGSITVVILYMQEATTFQAEALLITSIFIICAGTALLLAMGQRILDLLGPTGTRVMMRLMGLIVMLIAVEFFFAGLTPYVQTMLEISS